MQRVFIDPSIVKYLYMEPTPRIISSIRQIATFKWFEQLEKHFQLCATHKVRDDFALMGIAKPNDCADLFDDLTMLEINDRIRQVATTVISPALLDRNVPADEFTPHPIHIAAAALNGIEYMLTWDCIDSHLLPVIDTKLQSHGYSPPDYKTPAEMLEDRGIPLQT